MGWAPVNSIKLVSIEEVKNDDQKEKLMKGLLTVKF